MWSSSRIHASSVPPEPLAPALWSLEELAPDGAHLVSGGESAHPSAALDVDAISRDAWERGFEEGRSTGEAAAETRLQATRGALDAALHTLQQETDHWVGNAQENICALAMAVARQVLAREVLTERDTVDALVRQALAEFPLDQPLIVRLHPADLGVLTSLQGSITQGRPAPLGADRPEVQWLPDPRVTRGGCMIEGRDRIIDGRIDTALERLYRRVTHTDA